jgi:hypothetical protein
MALNFAALSWFLALAGHCARGTNTPPAISYQETDYVSDADYRFQRNADVVAEQWCVNYPRGTIDMERGQVELENGVGGHNFFLDVLSSAESPSEVGPELADELHNTRLYVKAFPIALALLLSLCWLVLCCTVCCRCCGRGKPVTQRSHRICTVVASGLVVFVLLGVVACTWAASTGSDRVNAGLENTLCSSAEFINTTFAGSQGETRFMGILPTLVQFELLQRKLDANSTFLREINRLLEETRAINRAVRVASGTLQLLEDTLENSNNLEPKSSSGESLLHNNLLSLELPAALNPTIEALNSGVAVAMAEARREAESQLSGERREDLQASLRQSIIPLAEQKDSLRLMLQDIINPDARSEWWDTVQVSLMASVLGIFVFAFLIVFFAAIAVLGCSGYNEASLSKRRRLACCSWCCAIYLAINALLVGGIMLILAVPVSGGCLIADDINGTMLRDISPAIGMQVDGDNVTMIADMLDQCINPTDPTVPANLLDILFVRNETDGEKTTLRQMFIGDLKDRIESRFAAVSQQIAIDAPRLAEDPRVVYLRTVLSANPADKLLIPVQEMQSTAPYSDILNQPSMVQTAFGSSAACDSFTPNLPGMNGTVVPGIAELLTELEALGSNPTAIPNSLPCIQKVTCNASNELSACIGGNALMDLKAELQGMDGHLPYRCNLFQAPQGAASPSCDVMNMNRVADSTEYTGDCLQSDGSLIQQSVPCDLADYTAYLAGFDGRINTVLQRIDHTAEEVKNDINVTMRQLLDEEILSPLDELADSMNCNYLSTLYDGLLESMCFQGMHGFRIISVSYVALGFLQVILIAVMYAIYRRSSREIVTEEAGKCADIQV